MYNNEITYHKKWSTPENISYRDKLTNIINRSDCCSDVPLAWAKEVHELMIEIDREYGIAYSTMTNGGYRYRGSMLKMLFVLPFTNLFQKPPEYIADLLPKNIVSVVWRKIKGFKDSIRYGVASCYKQLYARTYNKIRKPRVSLGQVKEKFGDLTIYFNCDNDYIDSHVDDLIRKAKIKIAAKGASCPIENLYYCHTSWYDSEHTWETKRSSYKDNNGKMVNYTNTVQYSYRKILKEMGYDIKDLKIKADRRRRNAKRKATRQAGNSSKKRP